MTPASTPLRQMPRRRVPWRWTYGRLDRPPRDQLVATTSPSAPVAQHLTPPPDRRQSVHAYSIREWRLSPHGVCRIPCTEVTLPVARYRTRRHQATGHRPAAGPIPAVLLQKKEHLD